jgi:hypothetical protein
MRRNGIGSEKGVSGNEIMNIMIAGMKTPADVKLPSVAVTMISVLATERYLITLIQGLIGSDVKKYWIMEKKRMEKLVKKERFPIRLM